MQGRWGWFAARFLSFLVVAAGFLLSSAEATAQADYQPMVLSFNGKTGGAYCAAILQQAREVMPYRYYPQTIYNGTHKCGADEHYQYDYAVILKYNVNQYNGYTVPMPAPTYKCPDRYLRDVTKAATDPQACVRYLAASPDKDKPLECHGVGDPINTATGAEHQDYVDYQGSVAGLLRFQRTYDSGGTALNRGMGPYWTYSYSRHLALTNLSTLNNYVEAVRDDGQRLPFSPDSSGNFSAIDDDIRFSLTKFSDPQWNITRWELKNLDTGDVEVYDPDGRLISVALLKGGGVTLAYVSGKLSTIADGFGHQLALTWNTANQITVIATPGGNIAYGYDSIGNLASATYPDTATISYVYENTTFPSALTGVIDAKAIRWSTISYDAAGRAIQSKLAGGIEQTDVAYNADGSVNVNDAAGMERTFTFTAIQGRNRRSASSSPAIGSCAATSQSIAHDANGNVTSRTDFNGVVTTYIYDLSRNLETSRTEAAGTPRTRTITTTWHATLRLPLTVTEPGRTTTYTYDASGNRLTKTVTDTATNASQTWTWTYNSLGQVLTEDGPRTDVSDITTYAYYDNTSSYYGSLQRITNAAGQVTEFTAYNASGQVLSQVDPNGVTTTFSYDARGRLTSRTSNGKATSYEYDAVGQMTKVTLPDGNWVSYVYDNAHRLTQIQDRAGNKIVYTLDAMSRRTKEEVQDVQGGLGALMEWIKRSLAASTTP